MAANLSHLQWRATEWLLAFGPLTPTNVMDYFVLSPFFDRASTNAQLRMQMMFSRGGMQGVDEAAELRKFVGVEFVLVESRPPGLFIVHKRERKSPEEATTTAVYYVLNSNIYQSPTLYTVLNERLLTSLHALSSSLTLLRSHAPKWSPEKLQAWDIKPSPSSLSTKSADAAPVRADSEAPPNETALEDVEHPPEEAEEREDFNPILWRALKSVASTLESPPVAQPAPEEGDARDGEEKLANGNGAVEPHTASGKRKRVS